MTNIASDQPTSVSAIYSEVEEGGLLDFALVLAQNLRLLILLPVLVGVLAFAASWLSTPIYTARAAILIPHKSDSIASALVGSLGGLAGAVGGLAGVKNPADQWIGLLSSRTIGDALVQKFSLIDRYKVKYRFEARFALAHKSSIETGKEGLIAIEVDDPDPVVAANMVQTYIDELSKLTKVVAVTEAGQRRIFFEQQMREAKTNLDAASEALQRGGINSSVLKTDPGAAVDVVARVRAQIAAAEVRMSVLRRSLTEQSPEVQRASAEIQSLRQQLAEANRSDGPDGPAGPEYVNRYRDFKYSETLYELMAKQYEIARLDEARDGTVIQVVDPPEVPEYKSKPKRAVAALVSATTALVLTFIFVFAREGLRNASMNPVSSQKIAGLRSALVWWRRKGT